VADTTTAERSLPRGRHGLSREEVAQAQRLRLVVAMAEALVDGGYVATPVAAVLRRAGVSRETFYELYDDKLACFLDALDVVGEVLLAELATAVDAPGDPLRRAEHAIDRYLSTVVEQPAFARLFLVEVHAAGAEAMTRRAQLQERVVDALTALLGARSASARFTARTLVAAISAMVATPLASGDLDAVRALRRPLLQHVRALAAAGLLGPHASEH
jgi:AcrR family transcriptional regulator